MLNVTNESFQVEVVEAEKPVVVDFWAGWCAPCRMMGPIFERLAEEFEDRAKFVKIDVDSTDLGQRYDVRGIPAFAVLKNGNVVDVAVGARSETQFRAWLEKALG